VSWPHVLTPHARMHAPMRQMGARFAACFFIVLAVAALSPAVAQKAQSSPVLPGGDSKQPININAAKLDYFDKEQKLVYTGDVVATQGDSTLKASALVLFLTPKAAGSDQPGAPSSSSQLRRMEATGPVTIVSKDQIGTGDSGVYEKAENKVYLIGNVTLTQGPNVTKGDKLIYDLTTRQAVVTGRVRSMFIPNNASPSNAPNNGTEGVAQSGAAQGAASGAAVRKKPAKTTP
jgi:lipopolysaccharide export system protein LptA